MIAVQTIPASKVSSKAWLVVALLCVVGCLNYLVRIMITTMRGPIVEAMPMTDAEFGLLTSAFLWVYGIVSPFAGYLSDRFKRSTVIIVSLFIWSAVTWGTAYATTFEELLFTRVLMGLSEACYIPAALALIADYHRGSTRSFATSLHMAGIMVGQGLSFMGGVLSSDHDWSYVFKFFGIIGVVYALVLVPLLRDAPRGPVTPVNVTPVQPKGYELAESPDKSSIGFIDGVVKLLSGGSFRMVLAYWGVLGMSWVIIGWLPSYYKEHFNLSQSVASVYATAYLNVASFIGVLLGGAWADRWSRTNPKARILVPVIGLCIAAPAIFLAGTTSILPVAIAAFMIYALTLTFSDANMMPILCLVSDPRYRATGYGILNMLSCIVGGFGIYASGLLRDAQLDFSIVFQLVAILIGLNAFLLCAVKPSPQAD